MCPPSCCTFISNDNLYISQIANFYLDMQIKICYAVVTVIADNICWSIPFDGAVLLVGLIVCPKLRGGTWHDRPMSCHPRKSKPKPGTLGLANDQTGVLSAPLLSTGRSHQKNLWFRERRPYMAKNNHCSHRTSPTKRTPNRNSHQPKVNWRTMVFRAVFKFIEATWMVVQIIQNLKDLMTK